MDSLRALASPVKSASFADDLLAALQLDDDRPTHAIPGAEPRPSITGEQEAEERDWQEYACWAARFDRYRTEPDEYGESLYFGAWGGHSLD